MSLPGREALRLRNCTTGEIVAERVLRAVAPLERALGFLARSRVDPAEGMWFDRCSAIHTIGMRANIDIVFVDREHCVVRIAACARRNRIVAGGAHAAATIELAPGIAVARVRLGDRLVLE